jgi:hypothetical protein
MAEEASAVSVRLPTVALLGAPCDIHQPMAATSFLSSGVLPSLGMKSVRPGMRLTRWKRSEAEGFPGVITRPLEPPFISVS